MSSEKTWGETIQDAGAAVKEKCVEAKDYVVGLGEKAGHRMEEAGDHAEDKANEAKHDMKKASHKAEEKAKGF